MIFLEWGREKLFKGSSEGGWSNNVNFYLRMLSASLAGFVEVDKSAVEISTSLLTQKKRSL